MPFNCIPTIAQKRDHGFKYMLLNSFLQDREVEETEYRQRVNHMAEDPEQGKQFKAFAQVLLIDALVMKTLLMITDDLEKLWKLPKDGIQTCIKQIEKEITGLEHIPEEADALKEARSFLNYLEYLLLQFTFEETQIELDKK